ncbi:MAG: hypothetical protein DRR19_21155, partial [Candidatus Parabeggiatoa sp. nov. 1]
QLLEPDFHQPRQCLQNNVGAFCIFYKNKWVTDENSAILTLNTVLGISFLGSKKNDTEKVIGHSWVNHMLKWILSIKG